MPTMAHSSDDAGARRRSAEAHWQEQHTGSAPLRTGADTQRLLHELEVHQIELEMQNAELERARTELETALEKYTDLYDFAPVGYLTLDREGNIREANLSGAELLGVARSALANRRFALFVAPPDRPAFAAFLQRVFAGQSREHCEVSLVGEGKPPLAVELEAIASASDRTCRVTLTDITERKRGAEDRLILSKLESTQILANGLAHDFNNLLMAIVLNLDLARTLAPPEGELMRCLESAKATAMLAGSLTKQLLAFSQGGKPLRTVIALPGLIRESVRPALSGSRVQSEFSLAEDLWPVLVDEGQIAQVIRNLIQNAQEAMPEGGVVSLRAENVARRTPEMPALPPGEYVKVSIVDRGVGIAPEILPKIFDPYFSTKQRGSQKGMGLGLTICHTIMQKHGGAMAVQSTPGAGSTFDVYLPAATQPVGAASVAGPRAQPAPHKILVMDDEEAVRKLCGRTLRKLGHEVELVENGEMAIAACGTAKNQGRPFDAVLLDLTVRNGLGGLETIQALRQIDPLVKAVVMSGYAVDPAIVEYACHGFEGALVKPFDIGKLQDVLARVLGRARDRQDAP